MALLKCTSAYAAPLPAELKHEDRDCAVRALAIASGEGYELAHYTLKEFGRVGGKGTRTSQIHKAAVALGLREVKVPAPFKPNSWKKD